MTFATRRRLLVGAAALACGVPRAFGAAVDDPLRRPALASRLAATSLVTAVTRAGDRLVAVGDRGTVLVSTDGGQRWAQSPAPVSVLLTAVRFATPERGWAVGHSGVVLATVDGGARWTLQLDGVRAAEIVRAAAEKAGGGDPALLQKRRTDAARLVADGADKPFLDLLVSGPNAVTVVGAFGLALHSDDGGATWQPWDERLPNPAAAHLYGIGAAGDTVLVAGEQGLLLGSADRGRSFAALPSPSKASFFGLLAIDERRWLVYGLRGQAFFSTDAGDAWQAARIESPGSLTAGVLRRDGSIVVASERGDLYASVDAGQSFKPLPTAERAPAVGLAEAADGGLVVAGLRGAMRIASAGAKS